MSVRVVLVGGSALAASVEREIRSRLLATIGGVPDLSVLAVPAASALDEVESLAVAAASRGADTIALDANAVRNRVADALRRRWPVEGAGVLLAWRVSIDASGVLVRVTHVGQPLGQVGVELLSGILSDEAGFSQPIRLDDDFAPGEPQTLSAGATYEWIRGLDRAVDAAIQAEQLWLCVSRPHAPGEGPATRDAEADVPVAALRDAGVDSLESALSTANYRFVADAVSRALARAPAARTVARDGPAWVYAISSDRCPGDAPPPADGGAGADAREPDTISR